MMVLHCMPLARWEQLQGADCFGEASVAAEGFVHCSSIEYFWRVAPNFLNDTEPLALLMLDVDKIPAEIRWEDSDNCGRAYPHVYGTVPTRAVAAVLPFLRNADGSWCKNEELSAFADR